MNVTLLIDAIVRQTTVLVAQLATHAGTRATLAHTANRVLSELVRELKSQGLGNQVIADMFGMSLRTYHNRVARLSESGTVRGQSLWEALSAFIAEQGTATRTQIMAQFSRDEPSAVAGVLRDLVDSGLVFRTGRGDGATYKAASPEEILAQEHVWDHERLAHLVWVAVSQLGPLSRDEVLTHVPAGPDDIDAALALLEREGRVRPDGDRFASDHCVITMEDPKGWEAAVFDHYQAVVTAIATKLRRGRRQAVRGEPIGGSTYTFDLWKGHPEAEEVLGLLQDLRDRAVQLRKRVEAHPPVDAPAEERFRVITYVGQTVIGLEGEEP